MLTVVTRVQLIKTLRTESSNQCPDAPMPRDCDACFPRGNIVVIGYSFASSNILQQLRTMKLPSKRLPPHPPRHVPRFATQISASGAAMHEVTL